MDIPGLKAQLVKFEYTEVRGMNKDREQKRKVTQSDKALDTFVETGIVPTDDSPPFMPLWKVLPSLKTQPDATSSIIFVTNDFMATTDDEKSE
ncbi:hypothetical protein C8J56DRAFT_1053858 [Mycena floridula]|nr:hypothetical protein C8J56DRAFT_1053858 [Mycena floridula]